MLHQPLCGYVVLKLLDGCHSQKPLLFPNGMTIFETCLSTIMQWDKTEYLRHFLISCGMSEDSQILKSDKSVALKVWTNFFREAAYVAAVFHDLGYPWQYAERIMCNLDGMNTPAVRQSRSAAQIVDSYGHRLLYSALKGYRTQDATSPSIWTEKITSLTDAAVRMTHGFPGALAFLYLNDCVRRYPHRPESPLRLLCIEWAAAAIMMHDMSKIYWGKAEPGSAIPENPFLRLSFNSDPLSALVTLADIIQDFERPTAIWGTCNGSSADRVSLNYEQSCVGTELHLEGSTLIIKYKMKNDESRALKRLSLQKEHLEYFDSRYGYLDMTSLGIDNVQLMAC